MHGQVRPQSGVHRAAKAWSPLQPERSDDQWVAGILDPACSMHALGCLRICLLRHGNLLQLHPGTRPAAVQAGVAIRRPDGDVEWPVRRPDGDVELRDAGHGFHVPACSACGGDLKPDVVFFGDGVPKQRADRWGSCVLKASWRRQA